MRIKVHVEHDKKNCKKREEQMGVIGKGQFESVVKILVTRNTVGRK